jgi:hypothetical protein
MKTEFQVGNFRYEPQHVVRYNGKLARPWKMYEFRGNGSSYFWVYQGTRFYPIRATKKDIAQ